MKELECNTLKVLLALIKYFMLTKIFQMYLLPAPSKCLTALKLIPRSYGTDRL